MPKFISLLRGINVSGKNLIKMDALKSLYVSLGFNNVISYIQSGNLLFNCNTKNTNTIATQISNAIKKEFGFDLPVQVLPLTEFEAIVHANPFIKNVNDSSLLHITFLSDKPNAEAVELLASKSFHPEEYIMVNQAIYLHCPNGYGNTKLNNNFFENKLKVNATTRNFNTCNELIRLGRS